MSEFVGIDVSKSALDVAAHLSGTRLEAENSEQGLKRLCAATPAQTGLPVAVVNARRVRTQTCWQSA